MAALVVTLYFVFLNPVPDFYPQQENDPFTYLSLAKGLIDGKGYPTKHWMPGFPTFLALGIYTLGQNFTLLKAYMLLFSLLTVCSCFAYFQAFLPRREAFWLALLISVTPSFFAHSHRLMSEIPCLAFSMLALATTEKISRSPTLSTRSQWLTVGTMWFAGVIAVLIRGNALALAPALLTTSIGTWRNNNSRRRMPAFKIAIGGLLVLITFGIWTARNRALTFDGIHNVTYLQEVQAVDIGKLWMASGEFGSGENRVDLRQLTLRIWNNIRYYLVYNTADCILLGSGALQEIETTKLGFFITACITAVAFTGWIFLWRYSVAGAIYLAISLALIAIYPTGGSVRMLVPAIPLLVLSGYFGISHILGESTIRGWLHSMVAVGIVLITQSGDQQTRHPYSYDEFADFVAVIDQTSKKFDSSNALVVSHRCHAIDALTDFKSTPDISRAIDALRSKEYEVVLTIDFEEFSPNTNLPSSISIRPEIKHGEATVYSLRSK